LAVVAHVRHSETNYDALLARGHQRGDARAHVEDAVRRVMAEWQAAE